MSYERIPVTALDVDGDWLRDVRFRTDKTPYTQGVWCRAMAPVIDWLDERVGRD